jgi:hypothetical protein
VAAGILARMFGSRPQARISPRLLASAPQSPGPASGGFKDDVNPFFTQLDPVHNYPAEFLQASSATGYFRDAPCTATCSTATLYAATYRQPATFKPATFEAGAKMNMTIYRSPKKHTALVSHLSRRVKEIIRWKLDSRDCENLRSLASQEHILAQARQE